MRILKSAQQRNMGIDKGMYTLNEINDMLEAREVAHFTEGDYRECYDPISSMSEYEQTNVRIFTSRLAEVKVVYHKEYGFYCNVAVGHDGKEYFVTL